MLKDNGEAASRFVNIWNNLAGAPSGVAGFLRRIPVGQAAQKRWILAPVGMAFLNLLGILLLLGDQPARVVYPVVGAFLPLNILLLLLVIIMLCRDRMECMRAKEELQEHESIFASYLENSPVYVFFKDKNIRALRLSKNYEQMLGMPLSEALGKSMDELFPSPLAQSMVADDMRILNEGKRVDVVEEFNGRFYVTTKFPIFINGKPEMLAGFTMDITERKKMEELLYAEKERAEITLHSIGDAVITTGVDAVVEYLNPVAEYLTGWKLEEAVGQPLGNIFHIVEEGSRQPAASLVKRCLQEGKVIGLAHHFALLRRDGREFSINHSGAPIRNRNEEITGVVLVFHDVTEERRLSRQVAHDAMHDNLTGLVNRREFEKRLERALVHTKEHQTTHILCYLDLDQFKIVNDTAGHAAGDELLKQVSGLLLGLFRQRDTFSRLGGDEFGLLLENCQLDRALIICNEIRARIRDLPFIWAGCGFQVTVSIGVVPITAEKESVSQLLSQADIACYSAKDLGRDRVYVYHADDYETTQRHSDMLQVARMREAIFYDRFRLFCQPIVQLNGGMIQYEVLLRMTDSEERLVPPGAFIPSAERYGLMPVIDRWVIRETLLAMAKHGFDGAMININLSGNSLDDEALLEYVLDQLNEFSIRPGQICFEITETAAIHHLSKAQQFIDAFRGLGGKIALDDFGSGFSSFRYLKTLNVDYIKIDGGFVTDMLTNPGDLQMVEAITKIAHTLGIKVIAEHASNRATLRLLREIGVDWAQGFGIGLPVPVDAAWGNKPHGLARGS